MFKDEIQIYRGKYFIPLWWLSPVPGTDPQHTRVGNAGLAFPLHPQKFPKVPGVPAHRLVGELSHDACIGRTRPVFPTAGARDPREWGSPVGS